MRTFYPPIEPYERGTLAVSPLHTLYYEQAGNPAGKPVVFIHGGPGGGCDSWHRQFFDPQVYRIVLFDQRGCGRSTPHASLIDNTLWHLVADMEQLRAHLGIDRWQLFGGSWGSTLAIAYAEKHPERVTEMVLRGIFLLRRSELLWFYQDGASNLFADAWEDYLAPIPSVEHGDLMGAYYRRLIGEDREVRLACARAWSRWEGATSRLHYDALMVSHYEEDAFALAFARIESHYFVHGSWLEADDQLLRDAGRLRNIPGVIVQGRYDVVCPMKSAWDLHKAWPEATLHVVPDAGHSALEPGIVDRLIEATDGFGRRR
jgi:proline iminopeptidase